MAHDGLRVLHVQRVKGIGGSERHLLFLLPALADAGVDVRMHVLVTDEGERFVDELRATGVAVTTEAGGGDLNPALLPGLVREIKAFDPAIVHTHLVHADVYGQLAAAVTRRTGISSVHATPDFYRRNPYRTAGRAVGRRCARRIAISEHVGRFVRDEGLAPPDRIRARPVRDGCERVRPHRRRPRQRAHRHRRRAGRDRGRGGLEADPRQGPRRADRRLRRCRTSANPDLRLLVAGIGELRTELEARADARCPAGSVRFLGFVEHIAEFMAACDVLAFPTQPEFGEGFGLAALEGMAAGRPVLATDVGPLPEIVVDGATGYVVPARSTAGFTRAITALADDADLRRRLGEAAARRARERVLPRGHGAGHARGLRGGHVTDRIRVLRLIDRLNVGGPALQVSVLAERLDPGRFEQVVLAGEIDPHEGDYVSMRAPGLVVEQVQGLGRSPDAFGDVRALRDIHAAIRRFRPHIVHTHKAKAGVLGRPAALARHAVPATVHTFHGHLLHGYFSPAKTKAVIGVERVLAYPHHAAGRGRRAGARRAGRGRHRPTTTSTRWSRPACSSAAPRPRRGPGRARSGRATTWSRRSSAGSRPSSGPTASSTSPTSCATRSPTRASSWSATASCATTWSGGATHSATGS